MATMMSTMMSTMMFTMMTGFLLLLLAGVTVSRVVDLDKRVYNGVPCGNHVRKYHVKLIAVNKQGNSFSSGGSLISEQWILTAGHNVELGETVEAILGFHPAGTKVKAVTIIEQPIRYIDPSGSGPHDLMLLELPDAKHGYPIAPRTDCSKAPKINDKVQIAGIGDTKKDPVTGIKGVNLETTLHCGDTTVVQCGAICTSTIPFYNKNEELICYKETHVDTSKGDSGGGVEFKGMIYGVHIRSGKIACDTRASAINICDLKYKTWINNITGLNIL
ncbi:cationic trypsin-like [Notothenia coriiceps]|uniref:Cationic trypsin-like n=1 Tax=Notothenia coriiceps TaxID=8208 RepID=A0A6I9N767_9TELE|nr:PREDICTED: cationic trypsin-like [Notothenia coriiceps]